MQLATSSSKTFSLSKRAARVIVRSSEQNAPKATEQVTSEPIPAVAAASPSTEKLYPTFNELMGFSGLAPELINGRLAMLGFIAALGAELASNQTVVQQFSESALLSSLAGFLFAGASLYTFSYNKKPETFGPFTPGAELLNGRAAMIGLFSLIAIEFFKGSALF